MQVRLTVLRYRTKLRRLNRRKMTKKLNYCKPNSTTPGRLAAALDLFIDFLLNDYGNENKAKSSQLNVTKSIKQTGELHGLRNQKLH